MPLGGFGAIASGVLVITPGASLSVTVGAGGAASVGAAGGSSSIGALVTCPGGGGATTTTNGTNGSASKGSGQDELALNVGPTLRGQGSFTYGAPGVLGPQGTYSAGRSGIVVLEWDELVEV